MSDELLHQTLENRTSQDHEENEDELENLELQLKQMAQSILHYRSTIPDQFKKTFASLLIAQRPVAFPLLDPGTIEDRNPDAGDNVESSKGASLIAEEDPETSEKIHSLKCKISSNIEAMPIILKRMNDCISKMETLDKYNASIHSAFKKKRTH